MRSIIFDTETTGLTLPLVAPLEKQPKIIEIGILVVEGEDIVEEFNSLVHPGEQITGEITKITGITNDDLVGAPTFAQIKDKVFELIGGAEACIAHNAPFDKSLVDFEAKRLGVSVPWPADIICTVQEFLHVFGRRPKLTELYHAVVGHELAQTHRAIDDAKALYEVLKVNQFLKMIGGTA
jgi:DNA polymerase III epsilon subunit family exonuclease